MSEPTHDANKFRQRAEREIALAYATGAKAHANPDFPTLYVERRDGTRETVRLPDKRPS